MWISNKKFEPTQVQLNNNKKRNLNLIYKIL